MSKSLLQGSVLVTLPVTKRRITVNSRKLSCAVLGDYKKEALLCCYGGGSVQRV